MGDDDDAARDVNEMGGAGLQSPGDEGAMPWSKAAGAYYKPFISHGRLFASTHADSACSPEDMSCATTADGASDGCTQCDTFDWANLRCGYIHPLRVSSALPPLPTVAETGSAGGGGGCSVITRSGRKVKPKKLSVSPPLRSLGALPPPPPLLLPLSHTISKRVSKQTVPSLLPLRKPRLQLDDRAEEQLQRQQLTLSPPLASTFTPGLYSLERTDSSSSVLPLPGCKCRKNGCLRRYCSCFAQSKPCGADCGCSGCKNSGLRPSCSPPRCSAGAARAPLKAAAAAISSKVSHSQAFEPKAAACHVGTTATAGAGGAAVRTGSGCSCKASNCLKRYCQCFAAGAACTGSCKCSSCHNKGGAC